MILVLFFSRSAILRRMLCESYPYPVLIQYLDNSSHHRHVVPVMVTCQSCYSWDEIFKAVVVVSHQQWPSVISFPKAGRVFYVRARNDILSSCHFSVDLRNAYLTTFCVFWHVSLNFWAMKWCQVMCLVCTIKFCEPWKTDQEDSILGAAVFLVITGLSSSRCPHKDENRIKIPLQFVLQQQRMGKQKRLSEAW